MPDHLFADPELAALYDPMCAGRADFDFYLPLAMAAPSVLDIGCGTGELLIRAREAGHRGRLAGLDPAPGMLAVARRRGDVEWTLGDLSTAHIAEPFDLVVMTGHAFQVFIEDAQIAAALAAIRAALSGRFVFETRNPLARAWEQWTPDHIGTVTAPDGTTVRMARTVDRVADGRVAFHHTFTSDAWPVPRVSHSTLRFLSYEDLAAALDTAGLAIEAQYGDWDRSPVTPTSPEIITVCRPQ
ncbi:MAG: class I SAM-dependent methyltransferase [Proteobacteria bacterium]|nr:class I SAM-dependent methyltransferase [Pseudomonadota bacterium]